MKEHYDFSKGIKNPYAADIRENGFTTEVYHSPEYVAEQVKRREEIIASFGGRKEWLARLLDETEEVMTANAP